MSEQARKFSATLVVAVNSLTDWEALQPSVEALARRHLTYGVELDHYEMVGTALQTALNRVGASADVCAAWRRVYGLLSEHMIATAYPQTT